MVRTVATLQPHMATVRPLMKTVFPLFFLAAVFVSLPASAQEDNAARSECSGKESHVEMRACLQAQADASARELRKVEDKMRKSLEEWDQEPEYIKRSTSEFNSSVKQFSRFRTEQCEFIASLAAGGNGQDDLRLSCIYELNEKRIFEIQQANKALAP